MPELLRVAMLFPQWRGVQPAARDAMARQAEDAVRRHLETVLPDSASAARIVLDSGTPHAGLLAQADAVGAGTIVVAPGDTAGQVIRHASVPVLVARPSPAGPVVGATDFSEPCRPALAAAAAEARRRGSPLHLVHVVDVGPYMLGNPPAAARPYLQGASTLALEGLDELTALAGDRLNRSLSELGAADGDATVLSGRAADTIVRFAETIHAGLVVVGTHGRSGLARMTLGSTASAVIDRAPCSVLVVPLAST
jgi:nucleotide-binding universal stress UspA family protein